MHDNPKEPSQTEIDLLVSLYQSNMLQDTEVASFKLLESFPESLSVLNLLAVSLQGQGKFHQAIEMYNRMIEIDSEHAISYCNRGVALKAMGMPKEALESYNVAIHKDSSYEQAYINRSVILHELHHLEDSLASLNTALKINPNNFKSQFIKGNVLRDLGRLEEAKLSLDIVVSLAPDFPEAHCFLGDVLFDLELYPSALRSYKTAVSLKPNFAEAYFSAGNVFKIAGDLSGAKTNYEMAIHHNPKYAAAHCNLGVVLEELAQIVEALDSYDRAIALQSSNAEAHSNRGVALQELARLEEALESFDRAIQLKPEYAQAYYNKANVLRDLGQLHKALNNHSKAIELRPTFAEAFANRGNVQQDLGKLEDAREDYKEAIKISPSYQLAYTSLLMLLNYMPKIEGNSIYELALEYGQLIKCPAKQVFTRYVCEKTPSKLRIGLVSGDFQSHPVGYFLESFLCEFNTDEIELFAYPSSYYVDELTERLKSHFLQWRPICGFSDQAAANLIHNDGIHILIDLSGHTQKHRLPVFAFKPAPIQVTWLGYFATTGIEQIDYLLGDPYVTPIDTTEKFSEKIWQIPDGRWCASIPEYNVSQTSLPALENGYTTFGCFGNYTKINDSVIKLWSELLLFVPTSKLVLKAKQFRDQLVKDEVITRFAKYGVEATRIIVEEPESRGRYFEAYNRIDITLDTFPFTGGTTSVDSLWMGVPVISLAGDSLVSRQGVGVLMSTGLSDWVAEDQDEYLAKAIKFSKDTSSLSSLRNGLREQVLNSPLFDAERFAKNFQDAVWGMWNKYSENRTKD